MKRCGPGRTGSARHPLLETHDQGAEEIAVKPVTIVGIILIILGVLALAYQGITYTTREKVIDIGPLKASVDKEKNIPLPPIIGIVALVAGVGLVYFGSRRS